MSGGVLISFDVRPVADNEEYKDAIHAIGQYFGMQLTDEQVERFLTDRPPAVVARDLLS